MAQSRVATGGITVGLSHIINWMPETDSAEAFRKSNGGEVEPLASLGSEMSLGFEWFPANGLGDSAEARSVQLLASYLQRGYRVRFTGTDPCLAGAEGGVYRARAAWLRLALFGRDNIPIARGTFLVWQVGGSYGRLLSALDNVGEVQFCNVPTESIETVIPESFVELSAGLGVRHRISDRVMGNFSFIYFHPIAISSSEIRPVTRSQARSLIIDVHSPNLAINIGLGWMF